MSGTIQDDGKRAQGGHGVAAETARGQQQPMTTFIESCLETVAGPAAAVERRSRRHPRVRKLLRILQDKQNILVTTHHHPDPDALASSLAMTKLLRLKLPDAGVTLSVKGLYGGGLNAAFAQQAELRAVPWDESALGNYDAIVLLDVQPGFQYSPLPQSFAPTAVIDHHRTRGPRPKCAFCDIRTDVGATSSIIFSYYMELDAEITPELAALLLFAIETDLAGAAGKPGELDNVALSGLTLLADTHKLYKMRYVDLPQSYYQAYATGIANAIYYEKAMISHLDTVASPEQPAVIADFLLRFDQVDWVLVTAFNGQDLALSMRTNAESPLASEVIRKLLFHLGEGGGHRTKAGGIVPLETGSAAEIERVRDKLKKRFLRALGIKAPRGQRLVAKD